jgi:hypothetical protein
VAQTQNIAHTNFHSIGTLSSQNPPDPHEGRQNFQIYGTIILSLILQMGVRNVVSHPKQWDVREQGVDKNNWTW